MQRKDAPSNKNKRKTPEQSDKSRDKGKEKEQPFVTGVDIPEDHEMDEACNAALDAYCKRIAPHLTTDEVMSEAEESEGESQEFVPETPQVVERPAKKVCRRLGITFSSTDLDQSRHAPFDLMLSLYS